MSSSTKPTHTGIPPSAHVDGHPSTPTLPSALPQNPFGQPTELSIDNQDTLPGLPTTNPPKWPPSKPLTTTYEYQLEVITAVAIVAIQVQLLTVSFTTTARALLSICMTLELLGILLAICFIQSSNNNEVIYSHPLPILVRLALRLPTVLILTGIVGLGAALVVETLQTSLSTAVIMSSFLVFGVVCCLLTLIHGLRRLADGKADGGYCPT